MRLFPMNIRDVLYVDVIVCIDALYCQKLTFCVRLSHKFSEFFKEKKNSECKDKD